MVLAGLLPGRILLADKGRRLITLDARHWREAAALAVSRSGLRNPAVLRRLAHAAALPFTICFLLAFAAKVHIGALLRTAASSSDDGSGGQ